MHQSAQTLTLELSLEHGRQNLMELTYKEPRLAITGAYQNLWVRKFSSNQKLMTTRESNARYQLWTNCIQIWMLSMSKYGNGSLS